MAENIVSTILRYKQPDGSYIGVFAINTAEDSYYKIDNMITTKDVLDELIDYITVPTVENMYTLTQDDVSEGTVIRVISTNAKYRVIDTKNLNNEKGYEIVTGKSGGFAGGSATKVYIKEYTDTDTEY